MKILCLDPGSTMSAWLIFQPLEKQIINGFGKEPNNKVCDRIANMINHYDLVVCEKVAAYVSTVHRGGGLSNDILDTAIVTGEFKRCAYYCTKEFILMSRRSVFTQVTGLSKGGDKEVRAALIKRFGDKGTMQNPGPLFGMASDSWSALAIGAAYWDKQIKVPLKNEQTKKTNTPNFGF